MLQLNVNFIVYCLSTFNPLVESTFFVKTANDYSLMNKTFYASVFRAMFFVNHEV